MLLQTSVTPFSLAKPWSSSLLCVRAAGGCGPGIPPENKNQRVDSVTPGRLRI